MSTKPWDKMRQEERIEHLYYEVDKLQGFLRKHRQQTDNLRRSLDAAFKAISDLRDDLAVTREKAGLPRRVRRN